MLRSLLKLLEGIFFKTTNGLVCPRFYKSRGMYFGRILLSFYMRCIYSRRWLVTRYLKYLTSVRRLCLIVLMLFRCLTYCSAHANLLLFFVYMQFFHNACQWRSCDLYAEIILTLLWLSGIVVDVETAGKYLTVQLNPVMQAGKGRKISYCTGEG